MRAAARGRTCQAAGSGGHRRRAGAAAVAVAAGPQGPRTEEAGAEVGAGTAREVGRTRLRRRRRAQPNVVSCWVRRPSGRAGATTAAPLPAGEVGPPEEVGWEDEEGWGSSHRQWPVGKLPNDGARRQHQGRKGAGAKEYFPMPK